MPSGINGDPSFPATLAAYARRLLQSAISNGVQVLGITPHSARVGDAGETSAVWKIVEEWNVGCDDDGTPFRDKIYAVFPGFEPSLANGSSGLHLLFLFDPEIGCERYLRIFDLIMGGTVPWIDGTLQVSRNSASDAFKNLAEFSAMDIRNAKVGQPCWDYITLAPHVDGAKGLLGAQKAQILERFEHNQIAGLELGDGKLPEDTLENRPWLNEGMAKVHQAFFHASDAYSVDDIGSRHSWVKLASPRIAALRQAFIASESRMRLGFEKDEAGTIREIANPPDVTIANRPWLKSVEISQGASFFQSATANEPVMRFDFSPDLTCVIGGSMTGKSTLLDGLRVHVGADMPPYAELEQQVKDRANYKFLVGSPEIVLERPGRDPTADHHERWPAVFYTQSELQSLAREPQAVEGILAKLVISGAGEIDEREKSIQCLGKDLGTIAEQLTDL